MNRVHLPPEIVISGTFNLLPDTANPNPQFATPEEYTSFIFSEYGLASPDVKVIDPMAGDGGFIDSALKAGAEWDAVELNEDNFNRIIDRIPPDTGAEIIHGDCMQAAPRQINEGYDAVVCSSPFVYMNDLVNVDPRDFEARFHREDFAHALSSMVRHRRSNGEPGLVFIDSAIRAVRDGRLLQPAADTTSYLTERYFDLCAVHRFRATKPPKGCDDLYTWLVFKKRWGDPGLWAAAAMLDTVKLNRRFHEEALRALASVSLG